jgi:hypothetical protein
MEGLATVKACSVAAARPDALVTLAASGAAAVLGVAAVVVSA